MGGLIGLILTYRYWILLPLTVIEGPIVAFITGTLAAAGYFDVWILAIIFFIREVVMDGFYYGLGHYGGKTAFVHRMLARFHVREDHLEKVRYLWTYHPGKTMLIGKLTYGVAAAFIVLAGLVGMNVWIFYFWGAIAAVVEYGGFLALGYFFGNAFGGNIVTIFENVQYLVAAVVIIGTIFYLLGARAKRLIASQDAPTSASSVALQDTQA